MLSFVAGYAPLALVLGAAVSSHGDALAGWSGSWLIHGGTAHLTARMLAAIAAGCLVGALIGTRRPGGSR
jgi:hypothetical protein